MLRFLFLGLVALVFSSCQQSTIDPSATAVVKDVRIPDFMPKIARFASHGYVDFREDVNSPWLRLEVVNQESGVVLSKITDEEVHAPTRWKRPVRVVSQTNQKGKEIAAQILAYGKNYDDSLYRPWPGPNSNTFMDGLLREVDGLSGVMEHNGVGKDFRWRAGPTAGGTGVEIQSPLLGAELGLKEGANLTFLGLTAGVGVWPPAVKLPFLPQVPFRPTLKE